jgi:hypothetical protein
MRGADVMNCGGMLPPLLCLSPCEWTLSMDNRFQESFIYFLDDDSLLCIFYHCQPVLLDAVSVRISQGGDWDCERWWYKLARVSRRWRNLILDHPTYLGVNLLCTYGTPVVDMLAHSPPRPLVLDYKDHDDITSEEEKGIMLALHHHERVSRIRLGPLPFPKLQRIIMAMGKNFPILDFLHIAPPHEHAAAGLKLPDTFQAPLLRHLTLMSFAFPIIPPFLATVVGLITLSLQNLPPSAYSYPDDLLQQLSSLPQLETLALTFKSPIPSRDLGTQLSLRPITTKVTLSNLRWLWYGGVSTYLEAILSRLTIPRLEWLQITFFHQLHFFMPNVLKLAENLTFGSAEFQFLDDVLRVLVYPLKRAAIYTFAIQISSRHLDWQVASAIQIFSRMRPALSTVKYLRLEFRRSNTSLDANNEAGRTQWRELLGTFNNVSTLRVNVDYLGQISRALQVDKGELPSELFSNLKELEYSARGNPFAKFADAQKNAGFPVTLVNHSTLPFPIAAFES